MLGYVDPGEQGLAFCRQKKCFWSLVNILVPYNGSGTYVFDCAFFNYLLGDNPDYRLLLTYKSPVEKNRLSFTNKGAFPVLASGPPDVCTKDAIARYLSGLRTIHEERLSSLKGSGMPRPRRLLLSWLLPGRTSELAEEGRRLGLLTKSNLVIEYMEILGFRNDTLEAEAASAYVLYAIDSAKSRIYSLISGHRIELGVVSKLVDIEKVLSSIS